jgi:uncharacterized protein YciI
MTGERNATVYLMISTYTAPLDEVDKAREDHMQFLSGLEERGLLVSAGRQDPPIGGVVLINADSAELARELMAGDPYVLRGLATYEPMGWTPTRGALSTWTP